MSADRPCRPVLTPQVIQQWDALLERLQVLAHIVDFADRRVLHNVLLRKTVQPVSPADRAGKVRRCGRYGTDGGCGSIAPRPWFDCQGSWPTRHIQDWW